MSVAADFQSVPSQGDAPLTVAFADRSTYSVGDQILAWTWNFGDGLIITGATQNPTHVYSAPGVYTVALTVYGLATSDTKTLEVAVTVTSPRHHPRIAYNNLFASTLPGVTIASSSDAPGFPHQQAYDGLPTTYWQPGAAGTNWLMAVFPTAQFANCFCLYGHNLGKLGGSVHAEYSTDGGTTWQHAVNLPGYPIIAPQSSECLYVPFKTIAANYWRLVFVTADTPPSIGCAFLGLDFECERGVWVGFIPPSLARDTVVTNVASDSGQFLGRSVIRKGSLIQVKLDFLTPAFVRDTWLPFVKAAEVGPFFLLWNQSDYPEEACFCFTEGQIDKSPYTRVRYMSAGFTARAWLS